MATFLTLTLTMLGLLLTLFEIVSASAIGTEERIRFNGYKVLRLTPKTEEQANLVKLLEEEGVSFWKGPSPANRSSDILVAPHMQRDILFTLHNSGMEVTEHIKDVEKLITEEEANIQDLTDTKAQFDFAQYHSLADAYNFLDQIAATHSSIARTVSIGKSFEGRDLKVLIISKSGESKPAIWFDSNIHAREWITSAVCLYVVNELLTSTDPAVQKWTEEYDWYIMPHHNPDGFEYSRTVNRMWRKTRSTTSSPLGCRGVDPNRNFGFHWGADGGSPNPCSETYVGPAAFSEKETRAASSFLTSLGDRLKSTISLHSYSQYMLLPYGVEVPFPEHDEYMRIGQLTVAAMAKKYGTQFTPGNIVDLLYVASGSSGDWAQGVRNTELSYTFELRDTGANGFILPANQIIPSCEEFMDGLKVLIPQLAVKMNKNQKTQYKRLKRST